MARTTIRLDPELLLSHRGWVRAVARALTQDEATALDIEQETWAAAIDRPPPRREGLRAWLGQVVRNLTRQERRSKSRRIAREVAAARSEATGSTADAVAAAEAQRRVADAVLALPEPYRATVLLRYFEELAPRAVAVRMGVPVETVRTRLRRAMPLLRAALCRRGADAGDWLGAIAPLLVMRRPLPWNETLLMASTAKKVAAAALLLVLVASVGRWMAASGREEPPPVSAQDAASAAVRTDRGRSVRRRDSRATSIPATRLGTATADRDESGAADASTGRASSTPAPAPAPVADPRPVAQRLAGRIVDSATGEPVVGARAYLVTIDHDHVTGAWGATAEADGTFSVGPNEGDAPRRADRLEIRARALGYDDGYAPAEDGVVVRLTSRDRPLLPGSVAGIVTDKEGHAVVGRVRIDGSDAVTGAWFGQWTETAADGSFTLEGVRPGAWRFHIEGMGERVDATVPEGAEARVHMRVPFTRGEDRGSVREVRVGGLPTGDGLFLRLLRGGTGHQFWRAAVRDGRAAFPHAQTGAWTLVLERGDVEDPVRRQLEVPEGDGPFEIRWEG